MTSYLKSLLLSTLVTFFLIPSFVSAQAIEETETTDSNSCAVINTNLSYGNRRINNKEDVFILQDYLNSNGYLSSEPTGFFGIQTRNAVIGFQKNNNITPATGYVGAVTRARIQELDCNGTDPTTPPQPAGDVSPYINYFTVSPSSVGVGEKFTLSWKSTNTNSCVMSVNKDGVAQGKNSVDTSGNQTGVGSNSDIGTYLLYLYCGGPNGQEVAKQVKLTITSSTQSSSPTPTVEFIGKPTLGVIYDSNNKEATLSGKAVIKITAGNIPVDTASLSSILGFFVDNSYTNSNNTKNYIFDSTGNNIATGSVIPANSTATYTITINAPTKELIPGSYTVGSRIQDLPAYTYGSDGMSNIVYIIGEPYSGRNVKNGVPSYPTILSGEDAPYISSVTCDSTSNINCSITGYNFDPNSNNVVVAYNLNNTKLYPAVTLPAVSGAKSKMQINFKMSDFGITSTGAYSVMITSKLFGQSNLVGVTVIGKPEIQTNINPIISNVMVYSGNNLVSALEMGKTYTVSWNESNTKDQVYVYLEKLVGSQWTQSMLESDNARNNGPNSKIISIPTNLDVNSKYKIYIETVGAGVGYDITILPLQTTTPTVTYNPSTTLSVSPTLVAGGGSAVVTWSANDVIYCTLTTGSFDDYGPTGAPLSGSKTVGPINSNRNINLSCSGKDGVNIQKSATITVTPVETVAAVPDLTVGTITTSSATGIVGQSYTFSANVSNIGTGLTTSFNNFASITTRSGWSSKTVASSNNPTSPLSAGATSPVSIQYTFYTAGTYIVSMCTDVNAVVTESNETNNCATLSFVVSAPVTSNDSLNSPQVLGLFKSAKTCVDIKSNMHRGAESSSVKSLQDFLIKKGLLSEKVSGFYGDLTVDAVKAYQASKGLPQTGMLYTFTREAIKAESCK